MIGSTHQRAIYLLGGAIAGVLVVIILTLAFTPGSPAAILVLDMRASGEGTFPYPLTIQNVLLVFFAVGIGDIIYRRRAATREAAALTAKLLPEDDRTILEATDLAPYRQRVLEASASGQVFLHKLIHESILNFHANHSTPAAQQLLSTIVDLELHRTDLKYTLLRYVTWALPTIGFIGTVVGIATSLDVLGTSSNLTDIDLNQVIGPLAMAFNTTIMALVLSAILVLLMNTAQRKEEEALNASADYCLRNLINRLYAPDKAQS